MAPHKDLQENGNSKAGLFNTFLFKSAQMCSFIVLMSALIIYSVEIKKNIESEGVPKVWTGPVNLEQSEHSLSEFAGTLVCHRSQIPGSF